MSIPEIKPLDLATVIRQAILHGRGYDCNPDTRETATPLTDADLLCLATFDPAGLPPFDRLQELVWWARKNQGPTADPERKTIEQLGAEIHEAHDRYCFKTIQHVKSGTRYMIVGAHYRESDMALSLEYTPEKNGFHRVYFARSIEEFGFGTRFIFVGGPVLGNAELDTTIPNHTDHHKRGFYPK